MRFVNSLIVFLILFSWHLILSQPIQKKLTSAENTNEVILNKKFEYALSLNLQKTPIEYIFIKIAKSFVGTPYVPNTLETEGEEELIINLQVLDCVTFYENSLVLARCIKKNKTTLEDFKKELQFVRYRNGIIDGYPSRLHYTIDYFYDNEKKGILKDITKEIGGVPLKKEINYMSTHIESYPHLREKKILSEIKKIEERINTQNIYHIPKNEIKKVSSKIKTGDILGITTSIEGLDCSHTGIAIWVKKELHMLHASSPGKKVEVTKIPLSDYLKKQNKSIGIIVARPIEP